MIARPQNLHILLSLALLLAACGGSRKTLAVLRDVYTEQEEARALTEIWQKAREDHLRLSFSVTDKNGATIMMSDKEWWARVDRVVISLDGEQIEHKVLKGENLLVLMGE